MECENKFSRKKYENIPAILSSIELAQRVVKVEIKQHLWFLIYIYLRKLLAYHGRQLRSSGIVHATVTAQNLLGRLTDILDND